MVSKILIVFTVAALFGQSRSLLEPNCNGKQTIVHLFEWTWPSIAYECEAYLGPAGFCGVQISPPSEHILLPGYGYPWWQRYQIVSYKLDSRSGTEAQFVDMVRRCNAAGVRIYADAVFNHMAEKNQTGYGSAGSFFDATQFNFPAVPYSSENFTPRELCTSESGNIENLNDASEMRNCNIWGYLDLYTAQDYVRNTIAAYLNRLIAIGVAGARIDSPKNIWPADIAAIETRLNELPVEHGFAPGSTFFVYQDFYELDKGEAVTVDQYYDTGLTTEFRYPFRIAQGIADFSKLSNLYDPSIGMARPDRAVVYVDSPDDQRGVVSSSNTLSFKAPRLYKMATAYTLAQDYGFTRMMSSYNFNDANQGPPSPDGFGTLNVTYNADGSCAGGWICEHRWSVMKKMVAFRNHVAGTRTVHNHNDGNVVAFGRASKGYFAMARSGIADVLLQTGLPDGTYCNIIDDCKTSLTVIGGKGQVVITNLEEPFLVVCNGECYRDFDMTPTTTTSTTVTTTFEPTTDRITSPPTTISTTTESYSFVCTSDGYYGIPGDCKKYYICSGGVAFVAVCPGELVFNTATAICDYPENVPECAPTETTIIKKFD